MKTEAVRNLALSLREKGYSYDEISKRCGVVQSTAQVWTKHVQLSSAAKRRLHLRSENGRKKSGALSRGRKVASEKNATLWAVTISSKMSLGKPEMLAILASIYYCEGGKGGTKGLSFTNSDPLVLSAYLNLLEKGMDTPRSEIRALMHLHSYHNEAEMKKYWCKTLRLHPDQFNKTFQKTESGITKKPDYKGCLNLTVGGVDRLRKVESLAREVFSKV